MTDVNRLIPASAMAAIQSLAEASLASDVSALELEAGAFKVQLRRQRVPGAIQATSTLPVAEPLASAPASSVDEVTEPQVVPITSERVGWFRLPKPLQGAAVASGDIVAYIESMSLMNEVRAPQAGRIVEVLVEPGHPVEYGQVLMALVPAG